MARTYLGSASVGTTMQNLNQSILLNLIVGLPPLAEQGRIVAKVEALMALCDGLEAALREGEALKAKALEAVLQHAVVKEYPEAEGMVRMAAEP